MADERAKKLVKKIVDLTKSARGKNVRLPPMGKLMRDVGYSESYSTNPAQKKNTKRTWADLMEEFLPESLVAQRHGELLNASAIDSYTFTQSDNGGREITDEEIKEIVESVAGCKLIYIKRAKYLGTIAFFQVPDARARKEAVDLAHKLRGKYAPEQIDIGKRKYSNLSNAELAEHISKLKAYLLKK